MAKVKSMKDKKGKDKKKDSKGVPTVKKTRKPGMYK